MATEELDDIEIVEETPPPTTSTEQELKKLSPTSTTSTKQEVKKLSPTRKKPGPRNPDQATEFVSETTKSLDRFMNKMHNYEPYAIQEGYQTLIAEYHITLSVHDSRQRTHLKSTKSMNFQHFLTQKDMNF